MIKYRFWCKKTGIVFVKKKLWGKLNNRNKGTQQQKNEKDGNNYDE